MEHNIDQEIPGRKVRHYPGNYVKFFKNGRLTEKGHLNKANRRVGLWTRYHNQTVEKLYYRDDGFLLEHRLCRKQTFWGKLLKGEQVLRQTIYNKDGSVVIDKYHLSQELSSTTVINPDKSKIVTLLGKNVLWGRKHVLSYRSNGKIEAIEIRSIPDNKVIRRTRYDDKLGKVKCIFYSDYTEEKYRAKDGTTVQRILENDALKAEHRVENGRGVWYEYHGPDILSCRWEKLPNHCFIGQVYDKKGHCRGWTFATSDGLETNYLPPCAEKVYATKKEVCQLVAGYQINCKLTDYKRRDILTKLSLISTLSAKKRWLKYVKEQSLSYVRE